jgi:hypothetical protein
VENIDFMVAMVGENSNVTILTANTTTEINPSDNPINFLSFNLICLFLILIPVTILNATVLVLLLKDSNAKTRTIRFLLCNIPGSCLVVELGLILYHTTGIILELNAHSVDLMACRATMFVIAFGGIARILFMAFFAFTVFVIVRCQEQATKKNFMFFVIMAAVLWIASFVCALPVSIEDIVNVTYGHNISCGPLPSSIGSYIYIGFYIFLFGFVSFIFTVVFLTLTICYICKNTVSAKDREMNRAMLKLGFFLLFGNVLNVVGQVVPAMIATFLVDINRAETGNIGVFLPGVACSTYVIINLSLIPTPILIITYYQPIRRKFKRLLCCFRLKLKLDFRSRTSSSSTMIHATNPIAGSKRSNSLSTTMDIASPV